MFIRTLARPSAAAALAFVCLALASPAQAQVELDGSFIDYLGVGADGTMINAAGHSMRYSEDATTPYSCDVWFPDTPVSSFTVDAHVPGLLNDINATNDGGFPGIAPTVGPTVSGRTIHWRGVANAGLLSSAALTVDHLWSFQPDDRVVVLTVTLSNTGGVALGDTYYMTHGDPDQGVCDIGSSNATRNDVLRQPPADTSALAVAQTIAAATRQVTIGVGAWDVAGRAHVSSAITNTDAIGTWMNPRDPNGAAADNGLSVAFHVSSLAVGASATFHVFYVWGGDPSSVSDRFDDALCRIQSDGTSCAIGATSGTCRATSCCTGCWNGTTCLAGGAVAACGRSGGACASCDDANGCTDDACSAGTCSRTNNAASCDDGAFCTVNDACSGGTCHAGTARDCGAGLACTTGSTGGCNEATDTCNVTVMAGSCAIDGACRAGGTGNPANVCQGCVPSVSQTMWSYLPAATCDSDGDTIPDLMEAPGDTDGDGIPNYLDPDDDGDGIPTATEHMQEAALGGDVDHDGIPAWLDTDSDGDGAPDSEEGTGDDDGDGIPNYLDPSTTIDGGLGDGGFGDAGLRDAGVIGDGGAFDGGSGDTGVGDSGVGDSGLGDGGAHDTGVGDSGVGDSGAHDGGGRDAGPNAGDASTGDASNVDASRSGGLAGGALCAVSAPGTSGRGAPWMALVAVGLFVAWRRRRAAAVAALSLLVIGSVSTASAQSVQLDQYRPAATTEDGWVLSRPTDRGHLRGGVRLDVNYAFNPLVYDPTIGSSTGEQHVVEHQLGAQLGGSIGLFDRLVLYAGLPVNLVMTGSSVMGQPNADGAGIGDFWVGARVRLLGERNDIGALALQATATFPTARAAAPGSHYSGELGVILHPQLTGELRFGIVRLLGNLGARFRTTGDVNYSGLAVGQEMTWGVGGNVGIIPNLLEAQLEFWGSTSVENFGARTGSPVDSLLGLRVLPGDGWMVGLSGGMGLQPGYGSPDFRGVLTAGWSDPVPVDAAPTPPPIEEEPATPGDRDHDGILDDVDQCPDQAEDIDQFQDADGCPDLDNDQDLVPDTRDGAPLDPEDRDGWQDDDGVPDPDNDGDGLMDTVDHCPLQAEDFDGIQDDDGCPEEDADGDQVMDPQDHCPLTPGVVVPAHPECSGCPALACMGPGGEIRILERVEFATGRDTILERSFPVLDAVLSILQSSPQLARIRIEGHTDDQGADARNLDLSRRRGLSVARWLVEHGVAPARLAPVGCGELHPLAPGTSRTARQTNRRVEFHVIDPAPEGGVRHLDGCVEATM